jgi:hypothetical protein
MQNRTFLMPARCAILLLASCFAALAPAQNPPSGPTPQADNDAWLGQTAKLYYSSAKAGLKGFDCTVRPDWQAVFATQDSGQVSADDQAKVTLLSSVKIVLHARMAGGSILDWNPPAQLVNSDPASLLNAMHGGINQTFQGFMQFWTPFVENQVVPDSSAGLDFTATADGGRQIHVATSQVEVTEIFDSGRILRHYIVVMNGTKIELTPTYSPSDHGLLVTHFHALIQPVNDPKKVQEMNVEIAYQWIDGFPIPARLDMDVTDTATLHFALDGCTVQR